jgi:replicative DNA helicase
MEPRADGGFTVSKVHTGTRKLTLKKDRGLPQNWEIEKALLGGVMRNPEDNLATVRSLASPGDFGRPSHRVLFAALCAIADRGEMPHIGVALDHLDGSGTVEDAGGHAYIWEMHNLTHADSVMLAGYARIVRRHAERRAAILAVRVAEERLFEDPEADPVAVLAGIQGGLGGSGHAPRQSGPRAASELMDEALAHVESRFAAPRDFVGIPTGFRELDAVFAIQRTDFVVIGARPAMGKTAFVLNLLMNMAAVTPGAMFSMEMASIQLALRLLARETGVETRAMHTGRVEADKMEHLRVAAWKLGGLPFFVDDTPGLHVGQIRARVRDIKARCPELGVVFVDYLQLLEGVTKGQRSRQEVIAEASRGLKLIAKEMDVAVVALSQLNRDVESRAGQVPQVSDLRESGAIEQDADSILLLYRPEVADPDTERRGVCDVIIAKQRSGQIGKVSLAWQAERQRFADLERREEAPWGRRWEE